MPGPGRTSTCLGVLVISLLTACVVAPGLATDAASHSPPAHSLVPSATAAASTPASASARPDASPTPSPTPDPSVLDLRTTSCDGGVVLEWSASADPRFHHYTALRSPQREIETAYPPIAPAVDWGDTYATDRFVTSAADASIIPSDTRWFYRVMAYDAEGAVIGASAVRDGRLDEVDDLGTVEVSTTADGEARLQWEAYGGFSRCFSSYRVMVGIGGGLPNTLLAVVSSQATAELVTDALHPGTTYAIRVQAMRTTTLESFVVGQTAVITHTPP
jgi:hypothetical protein